MKKFQFVVEELDLSQAEPWNGNEGIRNFMVRRLKSLGLYSHNLIFRGFDGKRLEAVRMNAVDIPADKHFFGSAENELASETRLEQSAIDYALMCGTPCISVYRGNAFRGFPETNARYLYKLKAESTYKDALLVVFVLKHH